MADENSDLDQFITYQSERFNLQKNRDKTIQEKIQTLYDTGVDAAFLGAGWGEHDRQITNNFSKLNRFGTRFVMDNYIRTGYTFISRPELNLSSRKNLRANRVMALLENNDPCSMQFMIRAYLDTRFARHHGLDRVLQSPLIDYRNPFFTLLTNNLTELSGGPTWQAEVHTDEGGFFGESQSQMSGSDSYKKPFDLQLSFIDPYGGPIDATIQIWNLYMDLLTTGEMIMYPDQEADRYMNYTVSIYRFAMDPSFRYIKRWMKYTGCFPISHPGASVFDFSSKDPYIDQMRKFSVGFRCAGGASIPNDPIILKEFNDLVERYFPQITMLRPRKAATSVGDNPVDVSLIAESKIVDTVKANGMVMNPILPEFNYTGIPYILDTQNGPRLDVFSARNELNENKYQLTYDNGEFINSWPNMTKAADDLTTEVQKIDTDIAKLADDYDTARAAKINSTVQYL